MISLWRFYIGLAWKDLFRLWSTTQHHIIIVAGICLPILMLMGLKRGHVETLRKELVTSPSGRQVTFWSAQEGELMDHKSIETLQHEFDKVDLIIPESQRVVTLRTFVNGAQREMEAVTLFATRSGDPLLSQQGIKPQSMQKPTSLVLGDGVLAKLEVGVGDRLDVIVSRRVGGDTDTAVVSCTITGSLNTQEHSASIGYADISLLDMFDTYGRGHAVPELKLPNAKNSAADTYASYLQFCERENDITPDDLRFLVERGFEVIEWDENSQHPLFKLMDKSKLNRLRIRELHTAKSKTEARYRLKIPPSEISEATQADDVIMAWNPPMALPNTAKQNENHKLEMIGVSLPKRTWLREYFTNPELPFDYEAATTQCRLLTASSSKEIPWLLNDNKIVKLVVESKAADSPTNQLPDQGIVPGQPEIPHTPELPQVLTVPANLLAFIHAHHDKLAEYDEELQLFVPCKQPTIYDRARLYARTIDDVPEVVKKLAGHGFAVMSETGRISEIQSQDQSLKILVYVVGAGVFLFGVITVLSVLIDSTDRKRGTIGILRVMGMSRSGIFVSILLRAIVIGALAALVSVLCGMLLSLCMEWSPPAGQLTWKPVISVLIERSDMLLILVGSILCCSFGAIPPAWKASRLDPFDAIMEGRFR